MRPTTKFSMPSGMTESSVAAIVTRRALLESKQWEKKENAVHIL